MDNVWMLAQGKTDETTYDVTAAPAGEQGETMTLTSSDPNAPGGQVAQKRGFNTQSLLFIGLMFVVMYFILFRGPRKKQQKHKQMVQTLQKNDRIRTIGGIIGTVVDIKDDEITLKVDESNNTKIKIAASAIGRNLSKD